MDHSPEAPQENDISFQYADYATQYPETIPLKSIDAPQITEQLVTLFSRVGTPDEILMDQGSN